MLWFFLSIIQFQVNILWLFLWHISFELDVLVATNVYQKNGIAINMKVTVFIQLSWLSDSPIYYFVINYFQIKYIEDCPDASDEEDCELADESQTRNPAFENARTFPFANSQNSITPTR